ncbi:MAG: NADP oxidoreductase, coenzyme F420-dependent [Gammaproteobacteria bacterium]|nr:NADP oxidoreductase, coenzyme F420-dependent [Gammaproteobacteria bacterium]
MKTKSNRWHLLLREFFICMLVGVMALSGVTDSQAQSEPMKIGIIGTGKIGGTLARHWVKAGHEVFISSRHPENLQSLAQELGPKAHAGTPREAAAFGEVILVSVPYAAIPQIGNDYAAELAGKVILDTSNPFERRDGPMAAAALKQGAGKASAEFLKTNRLVRAYNCIPAAVLAGQATRTHDRIAIPIAGDDAEALAVAERLVRDSGFDPVVVGTLEDSRIFELGQPLATGQMTAAEMQQKLKELKKGTK